jgi:hypothetical protein
MCSFFNRLKCVLPLEIRLSREDVWIQLTDLPPPHLCACSSCLCRGFLCSVKNKMRGDCFVDIGVIDDHHCLNFLTCTYSLPLQKPLSITQINDNINMDNIVAGLIILWCLTPLAAYVVVFCVQLRIR